ncbi:MAG: hypothetical protein ACXW2I_06695 [Burkholderiales bacterium]
MSFLVLTTGCAGNPFGPHDADALPEARTLGVLEGSYDPRTWRWITNPDGRALLEHARIDKCFIDPHPREALEDQAFTAKREQRTIGRTRYEVVTLLENQELWEVVYLRAGTEKPLLGVYSAGECQREAERILEAYEHKQD